MEKISQISLKIDIFLKCPITAPLKLTKQKFTVDRITPRRHRT